MSFIRSRLVYDAVLYALGKFSYIPDMARKIYRSYGWAKAIRVLQKEYPEYRVYIPGAGIGHVYVSREGIKIYVVGDAVRRVHWEQVLDLIIMEGSLRLDGMV